MKQRKKIMQRIQQSTMEAIKVRQYMLHSGGSSMLCVVIYPG